MHFRIQEPNRELTEGYFILVIKYTCIFLAGWMLGILIIYTYPCLAWEGEKYPPTLMLLDRYHVFSWICSLILIANFSKSVYNKSKLAVITDFNFDDTQLNLSMINCYSGRELNDTLDQASAEIEFEEQQSSLYGKQRIFHFKQKNKLVTTLNIDKSDWRKHPEIDQLVDQLKNWNA